LPSQNETRKSAIAYKKKQHNTHASVARFLYDYSAANCYP